MPLAMRPVNAASNSASVMPATWRTAMARRRRSLATFIRRAPTIFVPRGPRVVPQRVLFFLLTSVLLRTAVVGRPVENDRSVLNCGWRSIGAGVAPLFSDATTTSTELSAPSSQIHRQ